MGDHAMLRRLQAGESVPLAEFARGYDADHADGRSSTAASSRSPRPSRAARCALPAPDTAPRPMTMAEKILAAHVVGADGPRLREARRRGLRARGRRLLPRVHHRAGALLPRAGVRRRTTRWPTPRSSRSSRTTSSTPTAWPRWRPSRRRSRSCATCSASSSAQTGVRDYSARDGVSPGHLPHGGPRADHRAGRLHPGHRQPHLHGRRANALAYGVGATEYAALVHAGFTFVEVPESIRFELVGRAAPRASPPRT